MQMLYRAISSVALLWAAATAPAACGYESTRTIPSRLRRNTETTVGSVIKLRLIDALTNLPIVGYDPLPPISHVDLNTLPSPNLSVEALANGSVASLVWTYATINRTESVAPWALCPNRGGDFKTCRRLVEGFNSTITVVPFSQSSAQGSRGTPYQIRLSLYRGTASSKAPATPPQASPTKAPKVDMAPTNAPVKSPVLAPTVAPTKAPAKSPATVPSSAPVLAPLFAPMFAPVVVVAPTKAPVKSPVAAPSKAPVLAPAATPVITPEIAPANAPIKAPAPEAPASTPIKAPAQAITNAPVKAPTPKTPTKTPVDAPTAASIQSINLTLVDKSFEGVDTLVVNGTLVYKFAPVHTIRADIADPSVQSVQFTYDGKIVRIENEAPYFLAGKKGEVFSPWLPTPEQHTLVATAFSLKNASGVVLAYSAVSFVAQLTKDIHAPNVLTVRGPAFVNAVSPPTSLEIYVEARDDPYSEGVSSGIARITVYLSNFASFNNYTDFSHVNKRFDAASPSRGKLLATNVTLPYPSNIPTGYYSYRIEVEDFAGNAVDATFRGPSGETYERRTNLQVYSQRVELLNVTMTPPHPIVLNASSDQPARIQTQITLKDDSEFSGVCLSASGNGFSTEDSVETEDGGLTYLPNCQPFPENRTRGQTIVVNLTLDMRPYFPTGGYALTVFSNYPPYSFDSVYLASKGFASKIHLVNPNVRADWKPPQVKSLTSLSPTALDLALTGKVNVTTRLVLRDDVSGFDGEVQFWLNNRIAATVSAKNKPLVAGQPMTFNVGLPIFDRPGIYPVSLVFKDRFRNTANVSSSSLAQQGFPLVVEVTSVINKPEAQLQLFDFRYSGATDVFMRGDISFGYRRVVVWYNFGTFMGFTIGGFMNLTATGVSDSNRGVVLEARGNCHPRDGSSYPLHLCFFLNETTPLGLYEMTADVKDGLLYGPAELAAIRGGSSNFTVTSYLRSGYGP
jgi:hypothetical protein